MKEANLSLQSHPDLAVFSIETIEKRVYETAEIYSEVPIFVPRGLSAVWIKGLRYLIGIGVF